MSNWIIVPIILVSVFTIVVNSDDLSERKDDNYGETVSFSWVWIFDRQLIAVSTASPYGSSTTDEYGVTNDYGYSAQTQQPQGVRQRGPYRYQSGTTLYYMPTIQPARYNYPYKRKPNKTKGKKGKKSKKTKTASQQQQQQQQQAEVVNCMNKNKMAQEMEDFKVRAKLIEDRISSNSPQLFNADLSTGYQFLIYDFVSLVEQLGRVAIKRDEL